MQYKKLLRATDFSVSADRALDHSVSRAQNLRAEVYLLHVFQRSAAHTVAFDSRGNNEETDFVLTHYPAPLDDIASRYVDQDVVIKTIVAEGPAWQWIINETKEIDADLAVIGRNGRAGLSQLFVGSAARGEKFAGSGINRPDVGLRRRVVDNRLR